MLGYTHAGLGWVVGVSSPTSDRRLRLWCTAAALLPDVDALAYLAGPQHYDRIHHTFGHNVFAGVLCSAAAAWTFRKSPVRTLLVNVGLVALCFASHLLTDMKFSGWLIHPFWPVNPTGYEFHPNLQLGHPANTALLIVFTTLPWILARWRGVTPLELLSPRLDRLFLSVFRRKNRDCATCRRRCNNRCDECTRPVCLRHARVGWRFRVRCPACASAPRVKPAAVDGLGGALARELNFLRSAEAVHLDAPFAEFLDRKLSAGLRRLDALPRTHSFWAGSDQRPSLAKVVDLCKFLLRETPDDEEARWVLFADKVLSGSADLGFSAIEPLILRDLGSLRWFVAAARWSYVLSGVDPVVASREPLDRLGKGLGSLEACLMTLQGDSDPVLKEAAARCFELFRGRNPFKSAAPA